MTKLCKHSWTGISARLDRTQSQLNTEVCELEITELNQVLVTSLQQLWMALGCDGSSNNHLTFCKTCIIAFLPRIKGGDGYNCHVCPVNMKLQCAADWHKDWKEEKAAGLSLSESISTFIKVDLINMADIFLQLRVGNLMLLCSRLHIISW